MEHIRDIKVVGIDESRLPKVRKEPYIDLFFQLSHEAPVDWCSDFNDLSKNLNPTIRIIKNKTAFIETYVRDMEDIPAQLQLIKQKVADCSEQYIERARLDSLAAAARNTAVLGDKGQQGKLNSIIASLEFDD